MFVMKYETAKYFLKEKDNIDESLQVSAMAQNFSIVSFFSNEPDKSQNFSIYIEPFTYF